jgi:outer membrane lipoprotein-sorting protein
MNRSCAAVVVLLCLGQMSFADSESLEAAKQELRDIRAAGRVPSFVDYVDLLNRDDIQLTDLEFIKLRDFLGSLQEPEISREELAERIAAKRERIETYVTHVSVNPVGTSTSFQPHRYELAGSGKKRYQCEWLVLGEGQEYLRRATSFDGKVVRQYDAIGNQATISPSLVRGSPVEEDYREELIQIPANPIASSMLLDSEAELGYFHPDLDLVALLKTNGTILFSEPEDVDGRSCLVVDLVTTVVYLDPELDYSVIRREGWKWERDADNRRLLQRDGFTTYADFHESGGIPFPTTITIENSEQGRHTVISVTKLTINGDVEESLFTDVIPDGVDTFEYLEDGTIVQVEDN